MAIRIPLPASIRTSPAGGWLALMFLVLQTQAATPAAGSLRREFALKVQPFLNQYCLPCHNEDKAKSGVRVDHLTAVFDDPSLTLWTRIQHQLENKAMPPEDEPQPSAEERETVARWVAESLHQARLRPSPKNGGARRLTVAQYRNTLRELLLLDDELADLLPPDAVSKEGFVNNQETLATSPLLVESYFEVAEKALERVLIDPKSKPVVQNFRVDLGRSVNPHPCPDALILGANSLLLPNADVLVTELTPAKPFEFSAFSMPSKLRFIEGYQGNDTVRGWRDFHSLYHSVFACMRGSTGYPKGHAYDIVPGGLLLRPALPNDELFDAEGTYGPKANFKISLRDLPHHGRFRVTVTAAKYPDALLLDSKDAPASETPSPSHVVEKLNPSQTIQIGEPGVYRVDVFATSLPPQPQAKSPPRATALQLVLGQQEFTGLLVQPAFLAVRLPAGPLTLSARSTNAASLDRLTLTRVPETHALHRRFLAFENRAPRVGVHLGLRRDCGSTLAPVGTAQPVSQRSLERFVFEGAIRNFPSPDVEADNVNYLAGLREIGVRSEPTDGRDVPRLLVQSVEFEGPLLDSWPPSSHRRIFYEGDKEILGPEAPRIILSRFATKAFRRPVDSSELRDLLKIFHQAKASGADFQPAIKEALLAVLTSPQFLFQIEWSKSPKPEPLHPHELASKLAFFLWNSPPDEELLRLAGQGRLQRRLSVETKRLLQDEKFERFTREFTQQWLALDKFSVVDPDRKKFPDLSRHARTHLSREPESFLLHLFRNNLPARNLIVSDFILANEVTASYYGLGTHTESGFQFQPLRHDRRDLGGLLAQASILAGLSDGRESNPVKRGAWLARRIIAEPPDDPPPNVPQLSEDTRHLSLRERLEKHRNQPGCAACHAKIDPWGIPFEEFDASGRLKSTRVDARSTLPGGAEVAGMPDLKRHLTEDRLEQVAFSFMKHLATYANGRTPTYHESEWLRRQLPRFRPTEYRLGDMLQWLVQSPLFLEK